MALDTLGTRGHVASWWQNQSGGFFLCYSTFHHGHATTLDSRRRPSRWNSQDYTLCVRALFINYGMDSGPGILWRLRLTTGDHVFVIYVIRKHPRHIEHGRRYIFVLIRNDFGLRNKVWTAYSPVSGCGACLDGDLKPSAESWLVVGERYAFLKLPFGQWQRCGSSVVLGWEDNSIVRVGNHNR